MSSNATVTCLFNGLRSTKVDAWRNLRQLGFVNWKHGLHFDLAFQIIRVRESKLTLGEICGRTLQSETLRSQIHCCRLLHPASSSRGFLARSRSCLKQAAMPLISHAREPFSSSIGISYLSLYPCKSISLPMQSDS